MSVAWREAMSVGDPVIDADHKHLVDMINDFETAVAGKINHRKVAVVLLGLVEYTGAHFKREEEIQQRVGYPYHDCHRRSHRDVLKHLVEIVQTYSAATGQQRDDMVRGLGQFLREWLIDHIIQSDLRKRKAIALSQQMAGVGS